MFFYHSIDFVDKIKSIIQDASDEFEQSTITVHIISGLSGGTGSGCFLDVCYLVKHVLNELGGGFTFGYFFLPDVNLDEKHITATNTCIRNTIINNAYAAMQELDYCTNFPENGGGFMQTYGKGLTISWNYPPVDVCHLIDRQIENADEIKSTYENSLNRVSEYVMHFLYGVPSLDFIRAYRSNCAINSSACNRKKRIGRNYSYFTVENISSHDPLELSYKCLSICEFAKNLPEEVRISKGMYSYEGKGGSDLFND